MACASAQSSESRVPALVSSLPAREFDSVMRDTANSASYRPQSLASAAFAVSHHLSQLRRAASQPAHGRQLHAIPQGWPQSCSRIRRCHASGVPAPPARLTAPLACQSTDRVPDALPLPLNDARALTPIQVLPSSRGFLVMRTRGRGSIRGSDLASREPT